jgi:hypothetical protein
MALITWNHNGSLFRSHPSPNKKAAKKLFIDEDVGGDTDQGFADGSVEPDLLAPSDLLNIHVSTCMCLMFF